MTKSMVDIACAVNPDEDYRGLENAAHATNSEPFGGVLHDIISFLESLRNLPETISIGEMWRTVIEDDPEKDEPPYDCAVVSVHASINAASGYTVHGLVSLRFMFGTPTIHSEADDDPKKLEWLRQNHFLSESVLTFTKNESREPIYRFRFGGFGQVARSPAVQRLGETMTDLIFEAHRVELQLKHLGIPAVPKR